MQTQYKYKAQRNLDWDSPPTGGALNRRFSSISSFVGSGESSRSIWEAIRDLPGIRNWRIMRDVAFLLTSLPIGLAAFIVALVGGVLGVTLSFFLVGIPILVWTVGLILRMASWERDRMNTLLDLNLAAPRYPADSGANVLKHLWTVVRSPQVWGDLVYMMLLVPIGIIQLALVLLPLEFIVEPMLHLAFGSLVSAEVFGVDIGSRFEALTFLGLGAVLLLPMLILMNIATSLHVSLARKLLERRS